MDCPKCGLPMSRWNDASAPPAGWYCDGPNDSTTKEGCFELAAHDEEGHP